MKLLITVATATIAALTSSRASAAECSAQQVAAADALVAANKALFEQCASAAGASGTTSFLSAAFAASTDKAAPLCASDSCVRALIVAMEQLPDCCSPAGASGVTTVTNFPRLADDILHQCDLIDEKLLAAELEAEIAKLPDLKVQIKSVSTGGAAGSGSGSGRGNTTVGDVDVVIDVKKRELMKDGGNTSTTVDPAAKSAASVARASQLALALAAATLLSVFA